MNDGSCTNSFNGFHCKCTEAWSGYNCRYRSKVQQSKTTAATVRETITGVTVSLSYTAASRPKYAGSDCFSNGRQCQNGGRCVKFGYTYACRCLSNFSGPTCEVRDDICSRLNPCKNKGKCTVKSYSSYECSCEKEFEGKQCEIEKPPCANVICENDGLCVNNATSKDFYCLCKGNFEGK